MDGSRFYFFCLHLLTPLGGTVFHTRYVGTENIPSSGAFVLCSNHKSVYDPFLLAVPVCRPIRYMAKSELFREHGALARALLYGLGAFPVHRGRGDVASVRKAEEILKSGGVVGIFPQGKCVFGNEPFRPKAGAAMIAAKTQSPVLPAAVCCDGRLRLFRRVTVRFGKLISAEELFAGEPSRKRVKSAAALLAERINGLLGNKT